MRHTVADQAARIGGSTVADGFATVGSHHINIEVHKALTSGVGCARAHAVSRVADRAGETILFYVTGMSVET